MKLMELLESTPGSTSSGSIASLAMPLGGIISRPVLVPGREKGREKGTKKKIASKRRSSGSEKGIYL